MLLLLTNPPSHSLFLIFSFQVGRDNAQELFDKAREWFVNQPLAISRRIREMVAAARRPPSAAVEGSDTFLTGLESGDDDKEGGDLFVMPQTSHGASPGSDADILPVLPPIGDPRRRSWYDSAAFASHHLL